MARCEQGYLCEVCGQDVAGIIESDLYLRYVLGEVPPERLHLLRERHIRCQPVLAQFIIDPGFEPVRCEGTFAKEGLDPVFVAEQEPRITRGWRRLQELPGLGLTIPEYPLPEVIEAWKRSGGKGKRGCESARIDPVVLEARRRASLCSRTCASCDVGCALSARVSSWCPPVRQQ